MFGRRPDARLVTGLSDVARFMAFICPTRAEALVYYTQELDVTATEAWLAERNAGRDGPKLTLFHLVLYAIARALHDRPRLNRFVQGGKLWQRNDIRLSFSAKRSMDDDGAIATLSRVVDPTAPLDEMVAGLMPRLVAKREGERSTSDKELSLVLKFPVPVVRLIMGTLKLIDRWGLMPKAMIDADPLFCSAFVANLGSVGLEAAHHHLWEWGTCSIFCVIGRVADTADGRRVVKLKWTYDERIADGFYAARSLDLVRAAVEQPGTLDGR